MAKEKFSFRLQGYRMRTRKTEAYCNDQRFKVGQTVLIHCIEDESGKRFRENLEGRVGTVQKTPKCEAANAYISLVPVLLPGETLPWWCSRGMLEPVN